MLPILPFVLAAAAAAASGPRTGFKAVERLLVPASAVHGLVAPAPGVTIHKSHHGLALPSARSAFSVQALAPELQAEVDESDGPDGLLERLIVAELGFGRALDAGDAGGAASLSRVTFDASLERPAPSWVDVPGTAGPRIYKPDTDGVLKQYQELRRHVAGLRPDETIGGWLFSKKERGVEVLWRLAEKPGELEVIRLYLERPGDSPGFSVSFFRGAQLGNGRAVVRRIVGFLPTPWVADTADAATGEPLGRRGQPALELQPDELDVLLRWGIIPQAPKDLL